MQTTTATLYAKAYRTLRTRHGLPCTAAQAAMYAKYRSYGYTAAAAYYAMRFGKGLAPCATAQRLASLLAAARVHAARLYALQGGANAAAYGFTAPCRNAWQGGWRKARVQANTSGNLY